MSSGQSPISEVERDDSSTIAGWKIGPIPFDIRNISGTGDWFLEKEEYLEWLSQDHGLLWIKGAAGVGKSVLMHFLQSKARDGAKAGERTLVVFNENKQNLLGIYKSLLWKLFDEAPDISQMLDVLNTRWLRDIKTSGWQVQTARDMLVSTVDLLEDRGLRLYIDTSCELESNDVRDIVALIESLRQKARNKNVRLQICFSSRDYPGLVMPQSVVVSLEQEPGHHKAITEYIRSQLDLGDYDVAPDLESEISRRSAGGFLWPTLVVPLLNRAHTRDKLDAEGCRELLETIPSDLSELFDMIVMEDQDNRDELRRSIQWALFCNDSLTLSEYYDAMQGHPIMDPVLHEPTLLRFLQSSSRRLLQLSTTRKIATDLFRRSRGKEETVVAFTHELVADYFLNKCGVEKLWPNLQGRVEGLSHVVLRNRCEAKVRQLADFLEHKAFDTIMWPHSFLDYAIENVIRHANSAQKCGIFQEDFLRTFPWSQWSTLATEIGYYRHRFTQNPSILYILATQDAGDLITAYQGYPMTLDMVSEDGFRHPLIAAVTCRSYSAVPALCSAILSDEGDISSTKEHALRWKHRQYGYICYREFPVHLFLVEFGHIPLMKAFLARHGDLLTEFLKQKRVAYGCTFSLLPMLQFLLDEDNDPRLLEFGRLIGMFSLFNAGSPEVAEELIKRKVTSVHEPDPVNLTTPLHRASGSGHEDMVEALLNLGADPNAASLDRSTPLMWARTTRIVELLLRHGADVSARNHRERTAIFTRRPPSATHLLLQHGADPNVRDKDGKTFLHEWASAGMSYDVPSPYPTYESEVNGVPKLFKMPTTLLNMKLLIQYGADVNIRDSSGRGPLNYARDPDIINLLESSGAKAYLPYSKDAIALQEALNRKAGGKALKCGGIRCGQCQIL